MSQDNNSKNDKILTNVEKDSDTDPKNPKFNVVVSLVNINNDLDSLTPEIRSQFLKISKEIVNATAETEPIPAGKEEKIFVTMETDDEAALLQNEPLDLSTSYNKHQTDQSKGDKLTNLPLITIFCQFFYNNLIIFFFFKVNQWNLKRSTLNTKVQTTLSLA